MNTKDKNIDIIKDAIKSVDSEKEYLEIYEILKKKFVKNCLEEMCFEANTQTPVLRAPQIVAKELSSLFLYGVLYGKQSTEIIL